MQGINGKVAIVTGGGSGIGRQTALHFATEGARVVVADVVADGGEETVAQIETEGGEATFVKTDVADANDVQAMVETATEEFGRLDFAHNNAGIEGTSAPSAEQTEDDWQRVLDINLTGVWLGMKYEIPAMLEGDGGAIVNTSSVAGLVGFPELAPYVASKHGVVGLTRATALAHAAQGIRVNAICPGIIDETAMSEAIYGDNPEREAEVRALYPAGRVGTLSEVAETVAWLFSDATAFMNGVALPIDGGLLAQ